MSFDVFINFDGNCKDAMEFYAKVFKVQAEHVQTYADAPAAEGLKPEDADRILYANLPIFGHNMMVSDCPTGMHFVKGTNVTLTLGMDDEEEMKRLFAELSEGGQIMMPIGETFFAKLYCMFTDKFGVNWQFTM